MYCEIRAHGSKKGILIHENFVKLVDKLWRCVFHEIGNFFYRFRVIGKLTNAVLKIKNYVFVKGPIESYYCIGGLIVRSKTGIFVQLNMLYLS